MEKEFAPYQPSLDMKELGFDEPCLAYWYNETPANSEGQCLVYYKKPWDEQKIINGIIRDYYVSPTWSQAFRWFRKKHGLHVIIDEEIRPQIKDRNSKLLFEYTKNEKYAGFEYEEAELECLKKLIEIVKNK